nr:cupin domain-containing protein [Actinomycetota bacterium]
MTPAAGGGVALELALAPVGAGEFFEEHWERRPAIVSRHEPRRFDAILSAADAERLVCSSGLRIPAFRLVRNGAPLPTREYAEDIPWRPTSFSGSARVERVAAEFARGATIVLQGLHLNWHPAALYCRALEARLGRPVQANAYYSPAAAQGFAAHHDTHDVLMLQVAGSKRWRVYEPLLELPLKSQGWSADLGELGAPVHDVTIEAGDTVYLPRGWPHEGMTSDAESLHLTIGIHAHTRLDALRAALERCAEDVEFRRSVPADGTLPGDLLERLAAHLRPEDVAGRMRRRFVASRRPILDDQLGHVRALDRLTVADPVERRPTVIADLAAGEREVTLAFEGKEVAFPARVRAEVEFVFAAQA